MKRKKGRKKESEKIKIMKVITVGSILPRDDAQRAFIFALHAKWL
jgi:hypothetical protein